jgi:hypothetical protein
VVGGIGSDPSCGAYYWFDGKRRSLWSLYLPSANPSVTINFWTIGAVDEPLARRMLAVLRTAPDLAATLPSTEDILARRYVDIPLVSIAADSSGVQAILSAVDLAAGR